MVNADHIFDQKYLISVGYFIGAPALVVDYSVVSPQSSLFCSSVHFNFWLVKTSDSSHSSSCVFNAKTSILLYFRSFTRFSSKIYILWKKGILNENHPNFSLCKLYLLYKHTNLNKLHSIPSKKNGLFQFHDTFFHGKFMLILLWTVPHVSEKIHPAAIWCITKFSSINIIWWKREEKLQDFRFCETWLRIFASVDGVAVLPSGWIILCKIFKMSAFLTKISPAHVITT